MQCQDLLPKWAVGVSQLTVAVALLTCESRQPTPSSWALGAAEPLEGCLRGSGGKGCIHAVKLQLLGPAGNPGLHGHVSRGQARSGLLQDL